MIINCLMKKFFTKDNHEKFIPLFSSYSCNINFIFPILIQTMEILTHVHFTY